MATRGKITDFFDLEEFERQKKAVSAGITEYVATATKAEEALKNLKASHKPSEVDKGMKEFVAVNQQAEVIIKRVGERVDQLNGQSKQLTDQILKEAKATKELSAAKLNEERASNQAAKTKDLEARASERKAKATKVEIDDYGILSKAFLVAARNAKNLAVEYGVMDKRAQSAAREANGLATQLKQIDASVGLHQRNVGNYASALDGAKNKLRELGTTMLSFFGITAGIQFLRGSVDEFLEMDKAVRILENTVKNIGLPELFGRIESSTKALKNEFKFLDDDEIIGVFNKLVVYGKLTEKQINQLIPVIVNFSVATGQTIEASASLLLKAMEGNGRALKEFGINMKDAKSVTEGFGLIMTELAPKVEGVGKAFSESAAGGIAEAKQQFRDLKEEVGGKLVPVLSSLLGWFNKVITGLGYLGTSLKERTQNFIDFWGGASGAANRAIRDAEKLDEHLKKVAADYVQGFSGKTTLEVGGEITKLNTKLIEQQKLLALATDKNRKDSFNKDDAEQYRKSIRLIRLELEGLYKINADATGKPLGIGDPDKQKEIKAQGPTAEELAERDRVAAFNTFKAKLEAQINFNKATIDNENEFFDIRLNALKKYTEKSQQLIEATEDFEKGKKGLTTEEIKNIETKKNLAIEELTDNHQKRFLKIVDTTKKDEVKLYEGSTKVVTALIKDGVDKANDHLKEQFEKEKELINQKKELYRELYSGIGDFVDNLIQGGFDREKNEVQDHIDQLELRKQKEIEAANQTIVNEQDKAAAIQVIEARAAAGREQLEKRKRQIAEQAAKFEKGKQAFEIAVELAKDLFKIKAAAAVHTATGNFPLAALALSQIPITLAIAGLSIGAILARAIPKYKHGKNVHDAYEGPAIVGDGGEHELHIRENGEAAFTPAVPTFTMVGKKDIILNPKQIMDMALASQMRQTLSMDLKKTPNDYYQSQIIAGEIKTMKKDIVKAITNKKETHIQVEGLMKQWFKSGNSQTEYLNRNLHG